MLFATSQLAMGLLRMGFVTIYLSTPITRGFTTAAAMYVVTSQIKHVVGISTEKYSGPLNLIYVSACFYSICSTLIKERKYFIKWLVLLNIELGR